jgi:hypothetical protein
LHASRTETRRQQRGEARGGEERGKRGGARREVRIAEERGKREARR